MVRDRRPLFKALNVGPLSIRWRMGFYRPGYSNLGGMDGRLSLGVVLVYWFVVPLRMNKGIWG